MTPSQHDESPFELRQLDPSPVDETPSGNNQEYFPSAGSSESPRTSFLGLGGHSPTWWLTRIQRYSTYSLTAFAALHITNTSLIPLATQSLPAADTYLLLTRPYYQSSPLELLLLGIPAALHVSSGVGLRLLRRRAALRNAGVDSETKAWTSGRRIPLPRLSATSALGYIVAPLLAAHLALTRAAPQKAGVPNIGLSYVAHAVADSPAFGFLSLGALITVAVSHTVLGWTRWLGLTPASVRVRTGGSQEDKRRAASRRWWEVFGVVAATTGFWMAGGLGVVARAGKAIGWEGRNYDKILKMLPLHG